MPGLPPGIKWLLIANVGVFLLQFLLRGTSLAQFLFSFALYPSQVVTRFYLWQPVTYSFLHVDLWEILWNMLTLWMFGSDLEQSWGTRRFLRFYSLCSIGPAFVVIILSYLAGTASLPVIGASAPIFGILLVCAVLWPDRQVLFILFPMKMKYFTILVGAITLYISIGSAGGAAGLGLLSGMAFGYLFLKLPRMRGVDPMGALEQSYKSWKLARARRKFQVYMKKQRSDRDIN